MNFRLAGAMEDERENAMLDQMLMKDKPKRKTSDQRSIRDSFEYGSGLQKSPSVRKALTLYRKRMERQSTMNESEKGQMSQTRSNNGAAGSTMGFEQEQLPIDAELARLIEKTYNYIYSVEDKRVLRMISKVEDLFDNAPILFDDTRVTAQLTKLKKLKQDANLLKSHVQIYKEQMAEQRHIRR